MLVVGCSGPRVGEGCEFRHPSCFMPNPPCRSRGSAAQISSQAVRLSTRPTCHEDHVMKCRAVAECLGIKAKAITFGVPLVASLTLDVHK